MSKPDQTGLAGLEELIALYPCSLRTLLPTEYAPVDYNQFALTLSPPLSLLHCVHAFFTASSCNGPSSISGSFALCKCERKNAKSCSALLSVISQFCQCFAGDLQVARCALHVVVCALVAMAGAPVRQLPVGRTLPFVSPPATCHTTAHPRCTNRTLRNRLPKLNRTKPAGPSCRLRLRSPSPGPVA